VTFVSLPLSRVLRLCHQEFKGAVQNYLDNISKVVNLLAYSSPESIGKDPNPGSTLGMVADVWLTPARKASDLTQAPANMTDTQRCSVESFDTDAVSVEGENGGEKAKTTTTTSPSVPAERLTPKGMIPKPPPIKVFKWHVNMENKPQIGGLVHGNGTRVARGRWGSTPFKQKSFGFELLCRRAQRSGNQLQRTITAFRRLGVFGWGGGAYINTMGSTHLFIICFVMWANSIPRYTRKPPPFDVHSRHYVLVTDCMGDVLLSIPGFGGLLNIGVQMCCTWVP
jgi:hypothetical protein